MMDAISYGWLSDARRIPSPNFDARPNIEISLLIIHGISLPPGKYGGTSVARLFCNCLDFGADPCFRELAGLHVSSHLFIDRMGELMQFVPLHQRAWHAGVSCFEGRENCNDFSVGIELEGTDEQVYTDEQYGRLVLVTRALQQLYPAITSSRIVGHCDVAPGRKTDPGTSFDWGRYRADLEALNSMKDRGKS